MGRRGARIKIPETPQEIAKRERRIARAYQSGIEIDDIRRAWKVTHPQSLEIARRYNVPLREPEKSRRAAS